MRHYFFWSFLTRDTDISSTFEIPWYIYTFPSLLTYCWCRWLSLFMFVKWKSFFLLLAGFVRRDKSFLVFYKVRFQSRWFFLTKRVEYKSKKWQVIFNDIEIVIEMSIVIRLIISSIKLQGRRQQSKYGWANRKKRHHT